MGATLRFSSSQPFGSTISNWPAPAVTGPAVTGWTACVATAGAARKTCGVGAQPTRPIAASTRGNILNMNDPAWRTHRIGTPGGGTIKVSDDGKRLGTPRKRANARVCQAGLGGRSKPSKRLPRGNAIARIRTALVTRDRAATPNTAWVAMAWQAKLQQARESPCPPQGLATSATAAPLAEAETPA